MTEANPGPPQECAVGKNTGREKVKRYSERGFPDEETGSEKPMFVDGKTLTWKENLKKIPTARSYTVGKNCNNQVGQAGKVIAT